MVYFKRDRFAGIAPAISPRLLGEQFGQIAENIDFASGRIDATKADTTESHTLLNSIRRTIYKYKYGSSSEVWLEWDQDVNVVPGPIPDDTTDRLYWTGQSFPRIGWSSTIVAGGASYPYNSYRLGVPAPSSGPTALVGGTATEETSQPFDVSYVFTLVTADGREGPPSAPSAVITMQDGQSGVLTLPNETFQSSHNFGTGAKKRIYRSNTGSTNTRFQFVDEVAFTATNYTDTKDAATLGEVLPSDGWIGPPDDDANLYPSGPMKGLIALANGVMAGFSGKRFCLSEAYLPHAWPVAYRITCDENIIAIEATANGVVALTEGAPYFITGTDPSAMTAIRVDLTQSCINEHSVVDMGDYVLYAGPDGLCSISSAQGQIVTAALIKPEQWQADFNPTTYRAFLYEGTYVAFDGTSGFVYDPRGGESTLSTLSTAGAVRGAYRDPIDGNLYKIVGPAIKKYQGSTTTHRTAKFKTKKFVAPSPGISMGWVHVDADSFPLTVKVYGDGTLIAHFVVSTTSSGLFTQTTTVPSGISNATLREPLMRLPATVAQEWEVQVEGNKINDICLAQSVSEIKAT